ncbi:hypothetical protein [Aureivirga marina]|uniref:hypothetical protein n=1 Tax=Aureivirga marina TaxID=1182451 RepID=UPI0018CA2DF3|nr:hypothetical protein [Aureivirga marina]
MKEEKKFENKENIFKDKLVIWSILTPLILAFIFMVSIFLGELYFNDNFLRPKLTIQGFENFYNWFKIPLYTAALAFPLGALTVSNFRAKQMHHNLETAQKNIELAQSNHEIALNNIEATQAQNTFNNYYKHVEEFEKRLVKLENSYGIKFTHKFELYNLLFPENTQNSLNLIGDITYINSLIDLCKEIDKEPKENNNYTIFKYLDKICSLKGELRFKIESYVLIRGELEELPEFNYYEISYNDIEFFKDLVIIKEVLNDLLNFSQVKNNYSVLDFENNKWLSILKKEVREIYSKQRGF